MTPQEEQIIELKFKRMEDLLKSGLKSIEQELSYIKEQTTKTNGRVSKLEELESNCPPLTELIRRVTRLEQFKWKIIGIYAGISTVVIAVMTILSMWLKYHLGE